MIGGQILIIVIGLMIVLLEKPPSISLDVLLTKADATHT
jgi:hypothetical protein